MGRSLLLYIFFLAYYVFVCESLECYVCSNQEDNNGKCITTIKTCEQFEDVCQTEIRWGSTPYWSQGAIKQYYISKKCSTKANCKQLRQRNMPYCTHIWYEDWSCSECCQGDRCNYFVISSANTVDYNFITHLVPVLILVIYRLVTKL